MKILVTGHLGYIGAVLVPMLRSRGYVVVGMDTGYFAQWLTYASGEIDNLDVRLVKLEQLKGVNAVVHLAALSNDPMGQVNPLLTDDINRRATLELAQLAKGAGVERFVFSSSCSIYGSADIGSAVDETAPFAPVTAYAKSKVDSEHGLRALADENFSPVFLRNATAYGLSPAMRFDLVVNNLVGSALINGEIVLKSDGSPWRPLVHVEDIGRAIIAAIEASKESVHCEAFNIGRDDQNFQVSEIAELVKIGVPGCEVKFVPGAGPDKRSYRVSFKKVAQKLPGFVPVWTLADGIQQMATVFADCEITEEEFLGRRYVRLEQLKFLVESCEVDKNLYWTGKV